MSSIFLKVFSQDLTRQNRTEMNRTPEMLQAISCLMTHSESTHRNYYHTKKNPEIWLAKVVQVDMETKQAELAEMVEEQPYCYKFKIASKYIDASKYIESFSSLVFPVDVCYNETDNIYCLCSKQIDIHSLVFNPAASNSDENYV